MVDKKRVSGEARDAARKIISEAFDRKAHAAAKKVMRGALEGMRDKDGHLIINGKKIRPFEGRTYKHGADGHPESTLTSKVKKHHPLNASMRKYGFTRTSQGGTGAKQKGHSPFHYSHDGPDTVSHDEGRVRLHHALTNAGYKHTRTLESGSREWHHPKYGFARSSSKGAYFEVPNEHVVHTPEGKSPHHFDKEDQVKKV